MLDIACTLFRDAQQGQDLPGCWALVQGFPQLWNCAVVLALERGRLQVSTEANREVVVVRQAM